jgi:hypothetical protein
MKSSLIYDSEPKHPQVPQTSFQKQYQRLDATDDARPLAAAYADIANAIECMDGNAEENAGRRFEYDREAAER